MDFSAPWLRDVIDVVLVSVIMYRILLILKGTRAIQILFGLGLVFSLYIVAQYFELITLSWLLDHVFTYLVLIVVILFQDEIRTALTHVGSLRFLGQKTLLDVDVVESMLRALYELRDRKTGALLVIEQDDSLGTYVKSGRIIDAELSRELLVSVFHTDNPLHDGAVIVRGNRLHAAGCFLPNAMDEDLPRTWGTRHRAAMGLSRQSDAVVLVVSEENQTVSLVHEGEVFAGLELDTMRGHLQRLVGGGAVNKEAQTKHESTLS